MRFSAITAVTSLIFSSAAVALPPAAPQDLAQTAARAVEPAGADTLEAREPKLPKVGGNRPNAGNGPSRSPARPNPRNGPDSNPGPSRPNVGNGPVGNPGTSRPNIGNGPIGNPGISRPNPATASFEAGSMYLD